MATLAELRLKVQKGFGDENEAVVDIAEIDDYINEGIQEVSKLTEMNSTSTAAITTTDADGMIAIPADYLKMKELFYNNQRLPMMPRNLIVQRYTELVFGEPISWYQYDYARMQLWPIKASGTGLNILLRYISTPAVLAVAGNSPALPAILHVAVADFAVARCYDKVADTQMSNFTMGRFMKRIGDYLYLRDQPVEGLPANVSDTEAEYAIYL